MIFAFDSVFNSYTTICGRNPRWRGSGFFPTRWSEKNLRKRWLPPMLLKSPAVVTPLLDGLGDENFGFNSMRKEMIERKQGIARTLELARKCVDSALSRGVFGNLLDKFPAMFARVEEMIGELNAIDLGGSATTMKEFLPIVTKFNELVDAISTKLFEIQFGLGEIVKIK